jgi:phospholipase C
MRNYLIAAALAASSLLAACGGGSTATNTSSFVPEGTPSPSPGPVALAAPVSGSPIYHVIVVIQENRTFDNLFASSVLTNGGGYPGANTSATFSVAGSPATADAEVPFEAPFDPDHSHQSLLSEELSSAAGTNLGF